MVERVINLDDIYNYFGGRDRVAVKFNPEKTWWLSISKAKIAEGIKGFPVPKAGWKKGEDGKYYYDLGWYEVPWYDCDDYAFAAVGWLRRKFPDHAIWIAVVFYPKKMVYHATVAFWNSDDEKVWIFEPMNRSFHEAGYSPYYGEEEVIYLIG